MSQRKVLKINPITRVEGHLEIEVTVEKVDGEDKVVEAKAACPMFRGFEIILAGRDPRDAVHYTQRVCGVCPVSHGMAASLALEDAFGQTPTDNGRILRNLVLGANYIQSHVLHFYHLAAPDYVNTAGILDLSPWKPRFDAPDLLTGQPAASLVEHYVEALAIRRKSHQMGAVFGGKLPGPVNFVPGGSTGTVSAEDVTSFRALLDEIRLFVDDVFIPDTGALATFFPRYSELGEGCGNLLSYGVFQLDNGGAAKLFPSGRYTDGEYGEMDADQVKEYVSHSWFTPESGNVNPSLGVTEPLPGKADAYSFAKAPRYGSSVHEVGPLARMWINGDYREGISSMDRLAARALETKKVADAMDGWLDELQPGESTYDHATTPTEAVGAGLTEAPRGALGHWVQITDSRIARYQIVTPTAWNASPMDDLSQLGPVEEALIGVPVEDFKHPLEVLRVVHSFDPCLACSVHAVRPGKRAGTKVRSLGPAKGTLSPQGGK